MPNNLDEVRFLTASEKQAWSGAYLNAYKGKEVGTKKANIIKAVKDPKVYLMGLSMFGMSNHSNSPTQPS
jgi:hypothetical protein